MLFLTIFFSLLQRSVTSEYLPMDEINMVTLLNTERCGAAFPSRSLSEAALKKRGTTRTLYCRINSVYLYVYSKIWRLVSKNAAAAAGELCSRAPTQLALRVYTD